MTPSFSRYLLVAGTLATVAACSDSSSPKALKAPDGASCTQGTINANGAAVTGTVTTSSCKVYNVWESDSTHSASHALAVQAGKLYSVTSSITGATQLPGYATSSLVGLTAADTELTVAISGWWGNTNPLLNVLWFYAPTSGTYSLRTYLSDTTALGYTYSTQIVTCPVIATVAAADTDYVDAASAIGTSGCKQQFTFFGPEDDSTYVNYYLVQFDSAQTRWFNVQSTAFTPGWEVGGPGFDSMWDLDGSNGNDGQGNGTWRSLTSDSAGTYTLAVGPTTHGSSGAYILSIVAPSLAPSRVPQGLGRGETVHLGRSKQVHVLR
jgi:hypothetical protein